MKQKIIVLSVNPYRMENDGRVNEGLSVRYLPVEDLTPVVEGNNLGIKAAKASFDIGYRSHFPTAPALYEADMALRVNSEGRPFMAITGIEFVSDVTVKPTSAK